MKLSEFKIGETFWMSGAAWLCTDIGSRVVTAIKLRYKNSSWYNGPPYAVAEHVIDENDQPACNLTPMSVLLRKEGYWRSDREPDLPEPIAHSEPWEGQKTFVAKLREKQDANGVQMVLYRGFAKCRLCNLRNGSAEYKTREWTWPSGYVHYIEGHNVEPSEDFKAYILGEE